MSASEKPAGSATPFSLAHFSHRSIFCIFPLMIWVRCTVAFSLWQTSQIMVGVRLSCAGQYSTKSVNGHAHVLRALAEQPDELLRHRPHMPRADLAPVHLADRHHLGAGTGKEKLVGHKKI